MFVNGSNCVDQSLEYALNSAYRLANVSATRIGNITVASPYTYAERNIRKLLNIFWFSYMVHCILKKKHVMNSQYVINEDRQEWRDKEKKSRERKRERERETASQLILNQIGSLTLTGVAVILILPQEMASSGRAPESLPSNSDAVLTNTEKSAPFL